MSVFNDKLNKSLAEDISEIVEENQRKQSIASALNKELGIVDKKQLPHELHEEYDRVLNELYESNEDKKSKAHKTHKADDEESSTNSSKESLDEDVESVLEEIRSNIIANLVALEESGDEYALNDYINSLTEEELDLLNEQPAWAANAFGQTPRGYQTPARIKAAQERGRERGRKRGRERGQDRLDVRSPRPSSRSGSSPRSGPSSRSGSSSRSESSPGSGSSPRSGSSPGSSSSGTAPPVPTRRPARNVSVSDEAAKAGKGTAGLPGLGSTQRSIVGIRLAVLDDAVKAGEGTAGLPGLGSTQRSVAGIQAARTQAARTQAARTQSARTAPNWAAKWANPNLRPSPAGPSAASPQGNRQASSAARAAGNKNVPNASNSVEAAQAAARKKLRAPVPGSMFYRESVNEEQVNESGYIDPSNPHTPYYSPTEENPVIKESFEQFLRNKFLKG